MLIRALLLGLLALCALPAEAQFNPTYLTTCESNESHGTGVFNCSVTTVDNSLLVVAVSTLGDDFSDLLACSDVSGGSLTWASRASEAYEDGIDNALIEIWTAPVSTGATFNVAVDCGATSLFSVTVAAVYYTGYDTGSPIGTTGENEEKPALDGLTVTLGANPAASSSVIGAMVLVTDPATDITEGTGYTEIEDEFNNSGFHHLQLQHRTGSTSTVAGWNNADTAIGGPSIGVAVEIKAASGGNPLFDTHPIVTAVDHNTYEIAYNANADADRIHVCVKVKDAAAPANGAAVEAGTGCVATATEATAGADDTIQVSVPEDPPRPLHDIYTVLEVDAGTYTAIADGDQLDECLDAPTFYQYGNCPGGYSNVGAGSVVEGFNATANPDIVAGDIAKCPLVTEPDDFGLVIEVDANFSYVGDEDWQYAECTFYDVSAAAYHADSLMWHNNKQLPDCDPEDNVVLLIDQAMSLVLANGSGARCVDLDNAELAVTIDPALSNGTQALSGTGNGTLSGIPDTLDESGTEYTATVEDVAGNTDEFVFTQYVLDAASTRVVSCLRMAQDICEELYQDLIVLTASFVELCPSAAYNGAGVYAQSPAPNTLVPILSTVTMTYCE